MRKEMTNSETATHLRKWVTQPHSPFAWPTDVCGYDQHLKFVSHRDDNWHGENDEEFNRFVLDYADALEKK